MMSKGPTRMQVVSRTAASLFGSYAFVWGFASLAIVLGVAAGMSYSDAQTLVFLAAFLVFLVCFCWAFIAASSKRVWGLLLGGGTLMTGVAWLLSRSLV